MNLNKYKEYLVGQKFSNALKVDLKSPEKQNLSRLDLIGNLVEGKRVIHAGCFDHSKELIKAKLEKNRWLHKIIAEKANKCLGVDIDNAGIDFMRDELGYEDVLA